MPPSGRPNPRLPRRIPRTAVALALLFGGLAVAATVTETDSARWGLGTDVNLDVGTTLSLTNVDTLVDDWYRHPWDDASFEEQATKSSSAVFSEADRCLVDSSNAAINGPTVQVNGHEHRTGTQTKRVTGTDYVATVPSLTPVPLPLGTELVDEVRFLTSGSHVAESSYIVRFTYDDVLTPSADVVVPIALDAITAGRDATTVDYDIVGVGVLTHTADTSWDEDNDNASDCAGNGGDEVTVFNPNPGLVVTDVEFEYVAYGDPTANTGWLSGPLSLTLVTTEVDYDLTYLYRGEWTSATSTTNAPKAPANAIWHQMSWSAVIPTGSQINVYLTCGNDDDLDGTLESVELATTQRYTLQTLTSPYNLPVPCAGRYLQYRVEVIDEFADDPSLSSISFTYEADADEDGYGDEGVTTLNDCNDGDPNIRPGGTESPGNNVDEDCNGNVDCYVDVDNDGDRTAVVDPGGVSVNGTCDDANEGKTTDPIDCDDNAFAIRSTALEITGDDLDQNCDTRESCYGDGDGDGDRNATAALTALGDTTCTGPNEGQTTDPVDCNDADPARWSGAPEIKGDEIDQNCDGDELCWPDTDFDGERANTGDVLSTNTSCNGVGEGATSDLVDCDDDDPAVRSTVQEVPGDDKDQNCDTRELCYGDGDGDGDRTTTAALTAPGDTTCAGPNEGRTADPIDCDDSDGAIWSGASEIKGDEVDQDCDGDELCWPDVDRDGDRANTGEVASTSNATCQNLGEAPTSAPIDCDDNDALQNSGLAEVVGNGLDEDCDSHDDCYRDLDGDGHGSAVVVTSVGATCSTANLEATVGDDCDDTLPTRYPGNLESIGNNVDNDCNNRELCYTDNDDDGARLSSSFQTPNGDLDCTGIREGQATDPLDCNDGDGAISPFATEAPGNSTDEDCSNTVLCYTDGDDDNARLDTTFTTAAGDLNCTGAFEGRSTDLLDCDDADPAVNPAANEINGNGVDDDCSGAEVCFVDADDDGARTNSTTTSSTDGDCGDPFEGLASDPLDCNDGDPAIKPGATEAAGDGRDQNCDNRELCYTDADNDNARLDTTFLTVLGDTNCSGNAEGQASEPLDCDDTRPTISPYATEVKGDEVDQNCDGDELCWPDVDQDDDRAATGQVTSTDDATCQSPGEAANAQTVDCDDNNADRASRNDELATNYVGNGVDNDCDGGEVCYVDGDRDGARTNTTLVSANASCGDPGEALKVALIDCDDAAPLVFPGAGEIVGNEIDNDCDNGEICYVDADGDDFRTDLTVDSPNASCQQTGEAAASAGPDCDDAVSTTNPSAADVCGNGVDDDCDTVGDHDSGSYLDDDGDGILWDEEVNTWNTSDCDDDSDDDGLTDDIEIGVTHTNPTSADSDGDGMVDPIEVGANPNSPTNTDGTDQIDALDTDDDNDGILSRNEDVVIVDGNPRNDQSDADGIPNPLDPDDDGDGVPTSIEGATLNTDGEGKVDWLDDDDDNDLIKTVNEDPNNDGNRMTDDKDLDGKPNFRDADDDGDTVPTKDEDLNGGDARNDDTDGDLTANYLDNEDDGDTILTAFEYNDEGVAGRDFDGDGLANHIDDDSDDDGFLDGDGVPLSAEEGRIDTNGDGHYDYLDDDSDGDGVDDLDEAHADSDGTGGVDRVDTDDDGDGVPTQQESGDVADLDNDNLENWLDPDSDGDGWSDSYEWTTLHAGRIDEDLDGDPNYVDRDSDGDRLPDAREGTQAAPLQSDADGIQDRLDPDDDGDTVLTTNELGANPNNPDDQDGDGTDNYLDTDDDGDGEATATEIPDGGNPVDNDTNGDGTDNYLDEDDDGDGIPTSTELHVIGATRNVDAAVPGGDADENHLDPDSDADGYPDSEEAPGGNLLNTDGTDTPDFVDFDSDNDNVGDRDEVDGNSDLLSENGDNLVDRRDPDDDGDQIPTGQECSETCGNSDPMDDNWDGDALADYLDEDDDGDGVLTLDEDVDGSGNPRDDNTNENSVFFDGVPDYLDDDDDGDGLLTVEEDLDGDLRPLNDDTDGDGRPNYRDEDDDGDSLRTWEEVTLVGDDPRTYDFPDGDLSPNFLDDDDDGDEIETICELNYSVDHLLVDTDGDSVFDGTEWLRTGPVDPNNGSGTGCFNPWDTDQDGAINALDTDDDNDGLLTGSVEPDIDIDCAPGTAIPQPDGLPAYVDKDSDNDGKPDGTDYGAPNFEEGPGADKDGDGIPDYLDCDDDGGVTGDSDSDGILNGDEQLLCPSLGLDSADCALELLLDPDFDDDMVLDGIELGFDPANPTDTDGDGAFDLDDPDDDGDGLTSAVETIDPTKGFADPLACTTPITHFYDLDGGYWTFTCTDANFQTLVFDFGEDSVGVYWNLDCDADGGAEPDCSLLVVTPDAEPNFRDADDDGDGKVTVDEIAEDDDDLDGDGTVNWHDPWDGDGADADPDGDGLLTSLEEDLGTNPYDADTDHDGLTDDLEVDGATTEAEAPDSDGDGRIDAADDDDDNDNVPTLQEGSTDPDNDGLPNHLDEDSDGDGTNDSVEGVTVDSDCDGLVDAQDAVDDGRCTGDSGSQGGLVYSHQGCGGCDAGGTSGGAGAALLGLAALGVRRRRR